MLEFEYDGPDGKKLVVYMKGTLTRDDVVPVRNKVERAFSQRSPERVVFDLSGATRMDTAGVALLVILCRLCKKKGIDFRIINPDERVRKVIRLAQLEKLLLGNGEPDGWR